MRSDLAVLTLAAALLALPAGAQVASLVRDIAPGPADLSPGDFGGPPSWLLPVGSRLFFPDTTDGAGTELWTSDGTGYGTVQVADLCPGPCSSDPQPLGVLGSALLFTAESPPRLWRTDGTPAGTFRLSPEGAGPLPRATLGNRIFFQLCPAFATGCELWASDGTVAGMGRLAAIGGEVLDLAATGHLAFALASTGTGGVALWASDGTAGNTRLVAPVSPDARFLLPAGDRVVVWASAGSTSEIWGSDGTPAGTARLRSFGADPGALDGTFHAAALAGRVYFAADDGTSGLQVWTSDGTAVGTARVSGLHGFTPDLSSPTQALRLGSRLLFEALDPTGHARLFASSGTPESTVQLSSATVRGPLAGVGSRAVFLADDGVHGVEPWASDGTPAGTALVADVCSGACSVLADPPLQPLSGAAFFLSGGTAQGTDLWTTDGTAAGTRRYSDFAPGARPVVTLPMVLAGGTLFFAATDPAHGGELWRSDGKRGGTRRVAEIGRKTPSSDPRELTALGGRLLFTVCDGTSRTVWTSDGTAAGTLPAENPGVASPCADAEDAPRALTVAAGAVYFLHGSGASLALWKTDGTPGGAVHVFDFPGSTPNDPPLAGADSGLWFPVPGAVAVQLWRSNASGVQAVYTLPTGLADVHALTAIGSQLYYLAAQNGEFDVFVTDASGTRKLGGPVAASAAGAADAWFLGMGNGRVLFVDTDVSNSDAPATSLWVTDGTPSGTVLLHGFGSGIGALDPGGLPRLAALSGTLYFLDLPDGGGSELWKTDGTPAGTVRVGAFDALAASNLVAAAGRLFFAAEDDAHGAELWSSDGTAISGGGTGLLRDLFPGPESGAPRALTAASGRLFFTADDGTHGVELWTSDGTGQGTRLVQDLAPSGASSSPGGLTVAGAGGDRLYFAADDGVSGRELWSLPLSSPGGCQPSDTRLCLNGNRFQVEIAWTDFQGNTGVGHAVALTADTGYFWFFAAANVEAVVKVLDGRGLNGAFWVFYGALSSVQYTMTVTDTQTGLTRRYENPSGQLASVGDTNGFGPLGASDRKVLTIRAGGSSPLGGGGWKRGEARRGVASGTAATASCIPGAQRLCLNGNRFAVTATWKDFSGHTGTGTAVSLTGDTGYFWFFAPTNVEVVLKVLDGRGLNGKFWVFYGALSNVEYTLTVTDTQTGAVKTYKNPSGQFASVADTGAF